MRRSGVHSVNNAVHEVGSITASKGGESESIGVLGHWGNGVLQNAKCKLQSMPLGCHCEPPPRGVATPWRRKFAVCIFHFAICNFSPTPTPHYPNAFRSPAPSPPRSLAPSLSPMAIPQNDKTSVSFIVRSISSTVLGMSAVKLWFPSAVITTTSSIRIPRF